jgi:G3E family GTPase
VVLLKSGCLCCTVRGEIADALLNLHSLRARGRIARFERVVIETTGLADPYPVLSTLRAHAVLRSHFSIGGTITTIDAVNGATLFATRLEAIRQVAAADVLVVTKADLADTDGLAFLKLRLAALNPGAALHDAAERDVSSFLTAAQWRPLTASPEPVARHGDFHTAGGVRSLSMAIDEAIDWTAFGVWLTALLNRHGDRIFRVKGILNVAGEDRPVAIHGVRRLVHPPVHLSAWPDASRQSRLVFIFEGIDPAALHRSFNVFNALSIRPAWQSNDRIPDAVFHRQ